MQIQWARGESHLSSQSIIPLWSAEDVTTSAAFTLRDLLSALENLSRPQESFLLWADQSWRISSLWEQGHHLLQTKTTQPQGGEGKEQNSNRKIPLIHKFQACFQIPDTLVFENLVSPLLPPLLQDNSEFEWCRVEKAVLSPSCCFFFLYLPQLMALHQLHTQPSGIRQSALHSGNAQLRFYKNTNPSCLHHLSLSEYISMLIYKDTQAIFPKIVFPA